MTSALPLVLGPLLYVAFVAACVLLSMLLHEVGHALAARAVGATAVSVGTGSAAGRRAFHVDATFDTPPSKRALTVYFAAGALVQGALFVVCALVFLAMVLGPRPAGQALGWASTVLAAGTFAVVNLLSGLTALWPDPEGTSDGARLLAVRAGTDPLLAPAAQAPKAFDAVLKQAREDRRDA